MQLPVFFIRYLIIALTLLGCGSAYANPLIDQLIGTTSTYLEEEIAAYLASSRQNTRYEISINRLDPRLRLPLCPDQRSAPNWKARYRSAGHGAGQL